MTVAGEKLADLNQTLMGVENALLKRKVDDQDGTIDGTLDIINKAIDDGMIDLDDRDDGGDGDDNDGDDEE